MKFFRFLIFFTFCTFLASAQKIQFGSSKGEKIDTLNVIGTKTDLDSLNRAYVSVDEMIEKVRSTNVHPGEAVHYLPSGNFYKIESFPRHPVDTVLSIPAKNKGWENLFANSNLFGNEAKSPMWNDLGSAFQVVENDTIHPLTLQNNVSAFILTNTFGTTVYNNPAFNTGIYQSDSVYTISFWARKGKRPQDSNLTLTIGLDYSGNPDVTINVSLTDEWQYYQYQVTALGNDRIFNWVSFRWDGDVGDKIYIVDPQLNKGIYSGKEYYETRSEILEKTDPIYANYKMSGGYIQYEEFRGIKGNEVESINYLTQICQDDPSCSAIHFAGQYELTDQVFHREHVAIKGTFDGSVLTGSNEDDLVNSRFILNLNDSTKAAFVSQGVPQIGGIVLDGFAIECISPAKAIFESSDDIGAQIRNIHTVDGADEFLENGLIFNPGSLNCVVENVKIRCKETGILGNSSNMNLINTKVLTCKKAYDMDGGAWDLRDCWMEDIESEGIVYKGASRLNIYNLYAEHVPTDTVHNGSTIRIQNASTFNLMGSNLHQETGINSTNDMIVLDSVGAATIVGNRLITTGRYYITTTENTTGVDIFSNKVLSGEPVIDPETFAGIADSSKVNIIDENFIWFGKFQTAGADIRDSYIRSSNDRTYTEGSWDVRNDSINLIGSQNLLTNSENIVEGLASSERYLLIGGSTGQIINNYEGSAELLVMGDETILRADNLNNNGIYTPKSKTWYTLSYEARKLSPGSTVTIQPQMNVVGQGDVVGNTDTITTSLQEYNHIIFSPDIENWFLDFAINADSVIFTRVQLSEGYNRDRYIQTLSTPILKSKVVFDGQIEISDNVIFNNDQVYSFPADITAPTYSITSADHFLRFNANSNAQTVTLPDASKLQDGTLIGEYQAINNGSNTITFISAGGSIDNLGTLSVTYIPGVNSSFKVIARSGNHTIFEN